MIWEYKYVAISYWESLADELNDYGKRGWELVHIMERPNHMACIFKRLRNE